jgi:hypothetical protein
MNPNKQILVLSENQIFINKLRNMLIESPVVLISSPNLSGSRLIEKLKCNTPDLTKIQQNIIEIVRFGETSICKQSMTLDVLITHIEEIFGAKFEGASH